MTSPLALAADRFAPLEEHQRTVAAELDWRAWLPLLFPMHCAHPFGEHHAELWNWVWNIRAGQRPPPFVAVWPRGGAKSTSAELAVAALAARRRRRYVLYVCETQDQADDHVANIAALFESPSFERAYPALAGRMVGKYGNSKGWRRNRLRLANGFTVDALGLDVAARGVKLEDQRPDLLVIDDVDAEQDTPALTQKKIRAFTRKLMPAGASDMAVLAIQNLVHPDSIFAQLVDGRADFLTDRVISGPIPAVRDLDVEQRDGRHVIVGGRPSWAGQDLTTCQQQVAAWGITAFLAEAQHQVEPPTGGMFDHIDFQRCDVHEMPPLLRTVVWVDPAVTDTDQSDSHAIQVDALGGDGRVYRLRSWENRTSPVDSLRRAISWAYELGADHVGVETDQGGDTWASVYREALALVLSENPQWLDQPVPPFVSDKAGAGQGPKTHRAARMLVDYETGQIVHVRGTHLLLERALRRFPKSKPFDLVDASFWSWHDLVEVQDEAEFDWGSPVTIGPRL